MRKADSMARGIYKKHVHEVRLGVDMVILLMEHLYEKEAEERGEKWIHDESRKERFIEYVKEANITNYCETLPINYLMEAINITRVAPPKPDIVSNDDIWLDFQDLDFDYYCGAHFVEDIEASDHGAIEYSGDDWAITLSLDLLPPGNWTLYAYVKADVKENTFPDDIAFYMGIYPGEEREVKVSEISNGYNVFSFPEISSHTSIYADKFAWFSCGEGSKRIYVDRIVAIKNSVRIVKPENGIYIMDRYIIPFYMPIIIGKITIEAKTSGEIDKVAFYIDNELKYSDNEAPYSWTWNEFSFGNHEIKVVAYNEEGNEAMDKMKVWILNL